MVRGCCIRISEPITSTEDPLLYDMAVDSVQPSPHLPTPISADSPSSPATYRLSLSVVPSVPATASASANPTSDNAFDELDATRGTAWQFELARLRQMNKRLKEEKALLAERKRDRKLCLGLKRGAAAASCGRCGSNESLTWSKSSTGEALCELYVH